MFVTSNFGIVSLFTILGFSFNIESRYLYTFVANEANDRSSYWGCLELGWDNTRFRLQASNTEFELPGRRRSHLRPFYGFFLVLILRIAIVTSNSWGICLLISCIICYMAILNIIFHVFIVRWKRLLSLLDHIKVKMKEKIMWCFLCSLHSVPEVYRTKTKSLLLEFGKIKK